MCVALSHSLVCKMWQVWPISQHMYKSCNHIGHCNTKSKNCRANKSRIYICDDIATQIDICMVAAFCCSVSSVQSAAQCCSSGSVSCCSIVQRCSVAVTCSRAMCSGGAAGCSCSAVQRRVGPAGAAAAEVSRVTVGGETPAQTHPVGLTATATQRRL